MLDWTRTSLWAVIGFLQDYNGAVTAVATVFIGVYTFVLSRVTRQQAILTRQSIELSRNEFIATHRPFIGVSFFETFDDPNLIIRFTFTNQGASNARILTIAAKILPGTAYADHFVFTDESVDIVLKSGQSDIHRVTSDFLNPLHPSNNQVRATVLFFCVGRIRYADDTGVERETGFYREWSAYGGNIWFIPDPVPAYEYAY